MGASPQNFPAKVIALASRCPGEFPGKNGLFLKKGFSGDKFNGQERTFVKTLLTLPWGYDL